MGRSVIRNVLDVILEIVIVWVENVDDINVVLIFMDVFVILCVLKIVWYVMNWLDIVYSVILIWLEVNVINFVGNIVVMVNVFMGYVLMDVRLDILGDCVWMFVILCVFFIFVILELVYV